MRAYLPLILALLLPMLVACSDGPGTTTMPTDGARLVAVSDLTQVLRFDERSDLVVQYEQADGALISGAVLDWEIDGFGGDAMIGARQSTTDDAGQSSVTLTAKTAELTKQHRSRPPATARASDGRPETQPLPVALDTH